MLASYQRMWWKNNKTQEVGIWERRNYLGVAEKNFNLWK